jgi:hypothetical protein
MMVGLCLHVFLGATMKERNFSRVLGSLAVLLLADWALQAQPIGEAQVGDWVSVKLSAKNAPTVNLKETLVAMDENKGTLKFEQSVGDKVLPAKEVKVVLDQLRDPAKLAAKLIKARIEKLNSGKDSVEIKGKTIPCEWTEFKVSFDAGGKTVESTSKVWVSQEVPLTGLVKMENEVVGHKTIMELVDYGRGK